MLYLDAAADRRDDEQRAAIEQVRAGSIFATPEGHKQYVRWHRAAAPKQGKGLVGSALESAVLNIARIFPDNVVRETARG